MLSRWGVEAGYECEMKDCSGLGNGGAYIRKCHGDKNYFGNAIQLNRSRYRVARYRVGSLSTQAGKTWISAGIRRPFSGMGYPECGGGVPIRKVKVG